MKSNVLAAQSLCINSVSFANNKRHGLGFCFDQTVFIEAIVFDNIIVAKQLVSLCGALHKLTYVTVELM